MRTLATPIPILVIEIGLNFENRNCYYINTIIHTSVMSFFLLASTLTTENSTIAANTNIIWNRVHTSTAVMYETLGAFCLVADP